MKKRAIRQRLRQIAQQQHQPTFEEQIMGLNRALQRVLLDLPQAMQDFAGNVRRLNLGIVEAFRLPPDYVRDLHADKVQ